MPYTPDQTLLRAALDPSLEKNITSLRAILQSPDNRDAVFRRLSACGINACAVYIEGMAGGKLINEGILYPCHTRHMPEDIPPQARTQYLIEHVLDISQAEVENIFEKIASALLDGKTVLLVEGCCEGIVLETRDYEKRNVDKTLTESVVIGSQQGFVENLRTNITLVRRILRSPTLITEMLSVGKELPTGLSLVYLKGVVNERALDEARRRLCSLNVDCVPDIGHLQQLIEDHPFMLLPQILQTERPDRAAHLIAQGRVAILMDNSPYALIVPVSLFDLLDAADDSFMRWQYGAFNRVIRYLGALLSVMLPGVYVAITTYHTHIIPMGLLTSIAEARTQVPFPVLVEALIMEFSFYLINEAGTRMPSQIGSALGIVGALILGQAAVSANIISPILIIIVAITGLGNYVIPDYGVSLAVQILRLGMLAAGALLGLYGILLLFCIYTAMLCSITAFGQPFMAPVAPWRPHGPNVVMRYPLFWRDRRDFISQRGTWLRRTPAPGPIRAWKEKRK